MESKSLPEPPHRDRLREIDRALAQVEKKFATLTLHQMGGPDVLIPVGASWQEVPARPGTRAFHVPHPDGVAGLYLMAAVADADAPVTASHTDQARLISVLAASLVCNGVIVQAGQSLWLAPGQQAHWQVCAGMIAVVLYDAPAPPAGTTTFLIPARHAD